MPAKIMLPRILWHERVVVPFGDFWARRVDGVSVRGRVPEEKKEEASANQIKNHQKG